MRLPDTLAHTIDTKAATSPHFGVWHLAGRLPPTCLSRPPMLRIGGGPSISSGATGNSGRKGLTLFTRSIDPPGQLRFSPAVRSAPQPTRYAVAVWRGVAWRGVAWRGVAWRGVAWRGVAWRGVAWARPP